MIACSMFGCRLDYANSVFLGASGKVVQIRAHSEDTVQSSNSLTWPNQYLSNSPKAALAAYQMEDQLQVCYSDIQNP